MKNISTLSINCLFVLSIFLGYTVPGCHIAVPGGKPPIWEVINKDTNTELFFGEQEKVVLEWMQQNDYRLKFSFQNNPPCYILELGTTSLCAAPNNDPEAWTKVRIADLTLEVHLDYFIIRIKDFSEAAFTLDGEGNPLPYDPTDNSIAVPLMD